MIFTAVLLIGCAPQSYTHHPTNSIPVAGKCPERYYFNGVRCIYRPPGESLEGIGDADR